MATISGYEVHLKPLLNRSVPPEPWAEGEKIPWHDAAFSKRMLHEHLSQEHDAASRRAGTIDAHVKWIHRALLHKNRAKILDLGCGPGLYTQRLAALGHHCVGIDYAPASIAYARRQAQTDGLACQYIEADVRAAPFGTQYDLVMMVHGELDLFRPAQTEEILRRGWQSLKPGGRFLAEVHTLAAVRAIGERTVRWYTSPGGLFSSHPHLCLEEAYWDETHHVATQRWFLFNENEESVHCYAASTQGYRAGEHAQMFRRAGYGEIQQFPSLTGDSCEPHYPYQVIVGRRPKRG